MTACFHGNALVWLRLETGKGTLPTDFVRFLVAVQTRFILSLASSASAAKSSLEALAMGKNETIRQLNSRVDSLLLAAGAEAPADADLLRYLKKALRPDLRVAVWTAGAPASFASAIRKAEEMESLLAPDAGAHRQDRAPRNVLSKKSLSAFLADAGIPKGDRSPFLAVLSASKDQLRTRANQPTAPGSPRPAFIPKMTDEIRDKCRAEGRCFRCRELISTVGHVGSACPRFPSTAPADPTSGPGPAPPSPSSPAAAGYPPTPRARAAAIGRRALTAADASGAARTDPSGEPHPGSADTEPGDDDGGDGADAAEDEALYAFARAYRASRGQKND